MDSVTEPISISASRAAKSPGSGRNSEGESSVAGWLLRCSIYAVGFLVVYALLLYARETLLR